MQLKYEKVDGFKAGGIFFTKVSEWNGLEEWRDPQGRKLIVSRAGGFVDAFHDAFSGILGGEGEREMTVISAAPDLIEALKSAQDKEKAQ